jgi:GLPGLI family protein
MPYLNYPKNDFMKSVLLFIFFAIQQIACAQENNIKVEYKCVFNKNFDRGISLVNYSAVLNIRSAVSVFYMIPDSTQVVTGEAFVISPDIDTFLFISKNIRADRMVFAEPGLDGKIKYYRDTLHPMLWELHDDKKFIDSFECNKATAWFRGRLYIAWYCPSIPVPEGPWKLGGLPGLILEAYESNNDLHFIINRLSYEKHPSGSLERNFPEPIPDYERYKRHWKEIFRKMDGALAARESNSSCVGCQSNSTSKVYIWEKWAE